MDTKHYYYALLQSAGARVKGQRQWAAYAHSPFLVSWKGCGGFNNWQVLKCAGQLTKIGGSISKHITATGRGRLLQLGAIIKMGVMRLASTSNAKRWQLI